MLIRFFVSNFLSFDAQTEFSMVAGQGTTHVHHVVKGQKRHVPNLLRGGLLYGANGSGKSNFVKAVSFARDLVWGIATKNWKLPHFKWNKDKVQQPTRFQFDILLNNIIYSYGFEIFNHQINEEYLCERGATKDRMIFERKNEAQGKTVLSFNVPFKNKKQEHFLEFIGKGTPKDTLFITECEDRNVWEEVENVKDIANVFNWFAHQLRIMFPDVAFNVSDIVDTEYLNLLKYFGINITDFKWQRVEFDLIQDHIGSAGRQTVHHLGEKEAVLIKSFDKNDLFLFKKEQNEIHSYKLTTQHQGSEAIFEFLEESDGTKRLFDFLPVASVKADITYIIDEIDRSLHPHLSKALLRYFLEHQKDTKAQFIATTHESSLLDLDLLRKDEIWFVEKDNKGATALYSLEEFKPRADTEIRKGYLQGRYGAIPFIENFSNQNW